MTSGAGPVYEITVTVDPDVADEFDAWLARHVDETLQVPSISRAEVFEQDDEGGRTRRITQYHFAGDADLDAYLAGPGEAARQDAADLFADRFSASARVLRHADIVGRRAPPAENCLNCGRALAGQYCGNCGQRAASRLISIWELLRDAFGDLLEFDSRLWRTLIPLVTRPGQLTRDYLRGRRARYMPPFRMYLVLSIVFFLLAFFDPREELGILFEAPGPPAGQSADVGTEDDETRPGPTVTFSTDGEPNEDCDFSDFDGAEMPGWLASRLTRERLTVMCNRIVADNGRAFLGELADNVPVALFVLLPLMALVLKFLYPLSKRFYVEHLLFVLHYHAFVFLILGLEILIGRLGSLLRVPDLPINVIGFAMAMYVPVYLYKAQRRVYEQGRLYTVLKFLMLALAYIAGLVVMLGLVAVFAAFSL